MASIRLDPDGSGYWRIFFRFGGRQFQRSLRTRSESEADAIRGRVEETIALVHRGRIEVPPGADLGAFLLSDGKLARKPQLRDETPAVAATLGSLADAYLASPPPAKEASTLKVETSYLRNVRRILGDGRDAATIGAAEVQRYARARLAETRRGKSPTPYTVRKEAKTLRYLLEWGRKAGHLEGAPRWALSDLELPKDEEKGHYLTYAEVETRIARGGMGPAEVRSLWDRVFLTGEDVRAVLAHVAAAGADPWVYPMFAMAAMTGARRSELVRSRVDDVDFAADKVFLREKKRDTRKSTTTRAVDLHPELATVLRDWLGRHPGGQSTLCRPDGSPLDADITDSRFESTLRGSRWAVLKGWHVFRHSFCSILASAGVDQRVIDAFVGHQTEEMRRRYRHLFPATLRSAILTLLPPAATGGAPRCGSG